MHFKLTLAYDGTPYHGWQVQPGLATVQGTLADAIHRITREQVLPQGSGRTDTGVHALAQVASFSISAPIPAGRLHRALNHCLPNSIRILSVEEVPETFHARHSAISKTYEYRIFPLRSTTEARVPHSSRGALRDEWDKQSSASALFCPPFLAPFVWPCPWPLSLDTLNRAAAHVFGAHDFTTFAASDREHTPTEEPAEEEDAVIPSAAREREVEAPPHLSFDLRRTPVRTITQSQWHAEGELLIYRVSADGFLHHMVRNLVGTFVQCGAARRDPASIPALLVARNRALSGPTAPPTGLFLVSVDYSDSSATRTVDLEP